MLSLTPNANSWQVVLADLAFILFLVTVAALSAASGGQTPAAQTPEMLAPQMRAPEAQPPEAQAPAQALYRAGPGLPTLAQWLAQQPLDPRASLTIVAQYAPGEEGRAWSDARNMAATAAAMEVRARVIIREGKDSAIHASLAYDQSAL